jgi:hypothetical protein
MHIEKLHLAAPNLRPFGSSVDPETNNEGGRSFFCQYFLSRHLGIFQCLIGHPLFPFESGQSSLPVQMNRDYPVPYPSTGLADL